MSTIGSLCSGTGALDLAAEQVTGGRTVWHCENEPGPSKVLAHRFPGVPNYGDLKALEWADSPVDVLTGGYPCQPFSGAGKRLGTDDPRHLFPWIAEGMARMRPPLALLENVRNHLTLGFDVVLAELDRIGYDVRWTVLAASDVGAPHRRQRLWIAARAREAGGWPAPGGLPTAWAEDGGWAGSIGLFGSVKAEAPGTAGVMVHGQRWDGEAAEVVGVNRLMATPRSASARTSRSAATRADSMSGPSLEQCVEIARGDLPREFESWDQLPPSWQSGSLLPTPRTTDTNGAGEHGDGGLDLRTAVSLLPTPTSRDHKGANQRGDDTCLTGALLPTPRATDGTKGGPNQRGSSGDLMLPSAVHQLLPTPAATDANGARNSSSGRREGSQHHAGDTLGDLVFDGRLTEPGVATPEAGAARNTVAPATRLLPTPAVNDMGAGKTVEAWDEWTAAQKALGRNGNGHGPSLNIEAVRHADTWGPYAPAIARWEHVLGRPAPDPTESGARGGRRLSRHFDAWLMGMPAGWVCDVPGITYQQAVKMCGNGVITLQAATAYALLGVGPVMWAEVAA